VFALPARAGAQQEKEWRRRIVVARPSRQERGMTRAMANTFAITGAKSATQVNNVEAACAIREENMVAVEA